MVVGDGETRPPVLVLALLGTSPGVVTELLWYLARIEHQRIAGLEIWTTSSSMDPSGSRALGERWGLFAELTRSLGEDAALLPQLPPRPRLDRPTGAPWGGEPFRVVAPTRADGSELDDIRSPEDAARFTQCLADRLSVLCDEPGGAPPLVASLAGGRKTMSAALQWAFSCWARPEDRLVHLLLHPQLEATLRQERSIEAYGCPTEDWAARSGVAVPEQVSLYGVPVVPLRNLVGERGLAAIRRLRPQVRTEDAAPAVRVSDDGQRVRIELSLGREVRCLQVHRAAGLGYAAICEGYTASDQIRRRIAAHGATPPPTDEALRRALNRIGKAIRDSELGTQFTAFLPKQRRKRWSVRAGSSVVRDLTPVSGPTVEPGAPPGVAETGRRPPG